MENARYKKERENRGIRNEEENNLYELWWQLKASFNDSNKFQFRMVCLCALFTYVCNVISAPLLQFHVIFMAHITTIQLFIISCKLFYHIILNIAFEILPTVLEVIERCHSDVAHDHHKNSIAYSKRGRV